MPTDTAYAPLFPYFGGKSRVAREVAANIDLADICENAEPGETIELDRLELA